MGGNGRSRARTLTNLERIQVGPERGQGRQIKDVEIAKKRSPQDSNENTSQVHRKIEEGVEKRKEKQLERKDQQSKVNRRKEGKN